ncbi:MAG: hypothetical protein R3B13_16695 [Polyangiaceae bacterium]
MSLPGIGDVVVTAEMRQRLEQSGVAGIVFRPLDKRHIVWLDWQSWDSTAPEPAVYPDSGEPEDYILGRPHDESAAKALGELWELVPTERGVAARQTLSRRERTYQFTLQPGTVPPLDIFRAQNMRYLFVTDRVRKLVEDSGIDGVLKFHPVVVGDLPEPEPPRRLFLDAGEPVPDGYRIVGTMTNPFSGALQRVAERDSGK